MFNFSLIARRATLAIAGTAILAFVAGIAPAQASDTQDAYYKHTRECTILFWTDPVKHDEQCLPSRIAPSNVSLYDMDDAPPPVVHECKRSGTES